MCDCAADNVVPMVCQVTPIVHQAFPPSLGPQHGEQVQEAEPVTGREDLESSLRLVLDVL